MPATIDPSTKVTTAWAEEVDRLFREVASWIVTREGWGSRRFDWDGHLDRLLVRTPKGEFMFSPAGEERAAEGILQFYSVPSLESVHLSLSDSGWHWYETPAGSFTSVRHPWDADGLTRAVDHLADRS